jgi:tRNA1(Val) A37 N6-methylase TrmN6
MWNLGQDGSSPDDQVCVSHADLRVWNGDDLAPYDLITGTPPYFPQERFVASENHAQKIRCRVPTRGAASDYIEAAARLLAVDGTLVVVETARQEGEAAVWESVKLCGLCVIKRVDVVTRTGLPPRFSCWVIVRKNNNNIETDVDISTFTLRNNDATKSRTLEYVDAMEAMGWIDFENTRQRNVTSPKQE